MVCCIKYHAASWNKKLLKKKRDRKMRFDDTVFFSSLLRELKFRRVKKITEFQTNYTVACMVKVFFFAFYFSVFDN